MEPTNYNHKINFSLSNNTLLIEPTQTTVKSKYKKKKCTECNKRRKTLDKSHQICHVCYNVKMVFKYKPSGNKIIDDFIRKTQVNLVKKNGKMEFVPYEQFINIEFIAEGGFSKIYKATWIDGPVEDDDYKKLKIFYECSSKSGCLSGVCNYYGITQDPNSQDVMILLNLRTLANGLVQMHKLNFIHRDFHSGNILINYGIPKICDLGISKSATESGEDNENYGIIPYMAPEILQRQKYNISSDIYSFGMIMWEYMTGRRPFWDRNHDTELIIDICDGLRPPIVTNAHEGFIELMKECWHSDPEKRPRANDLYSKINIMTREELARDNITKIIKSPDIGPVTLNNPGAVYKSRPLEKKLFPADP
ncbi:kinase-like domain-containing protein [Rhizophagus clarus]|uniref:Kinase-like domain-containing protein n=1 Tax=Rhizophagus clarus TaxID=94130 RepID=A0A8H3QLG2_9GLOM|nr:kinase-like domain-containing protein [Rhizophagus clarus]